MDPCNAEPSSPQLCANQCGFYGTKASNNLCSKCFIKQVKEKQEREASSNILPSRKDDDNKDAARADEKKNEKVMCSCCNKRIRQLMIFECRCGGKFCMKHRFPEDHLCAFDSKDHGDRLAFAMDNLLIKADKLHHKNLDFLVSSHGQAVD